MWRNNTVIGESVSRKFIMHTLSCTRSRKHNTCVQKRKQKDTQQCSRKRVQQLQKNVKSHVFLKSEKNVKNVKKRRPTAYVHFTGCSITQPLILNYRNRNSVPVPFFNFFIVIWTFSTSVVYRATCRVIITKTARSTACSSTGWPRWDRYEIRYEMLF